jgi:hypothetical protein
MSGNKDAFVLKSVYILTILIGLLLSGCTNNIGCEGNIIVENSIPDLTLYIGEEPYSRDLIYEQPSVFRHTRNVRIAFEPTTSDGAIVASVTMRYNANKNHLSILEITPRSIGEAIVEVSALDNCTDRDKVTSFKVTVLDTIPIEP